MVGKEQERQGIAKHGIKVPKVTIVPGGSCGTVRRAYNLNFLYKCYG